MTQQTLSPKPASAMVKQAQEDFRQTLPTDDRQDFADAERGLIDSLPDGEYALPSGRIAWSLKPYAFLGADEVPDTINPSLWRQAQLNMNHGLYEVTQGLYQVRGIDMANMTIVEGKTGIIIIDTLSSQEGAKAALALYAKNRGERPVKAVIVTHTHVDHWGGLLGVASIEDYTSGKVALLAPDQFMEHAVSENVIAGNAMRRRALYQFGNLLRPGPQGHVDNGLGKTYAVGRVGLVSPNDLIMATGDTREIDGVRIEFQMAPDTEAPAEMHMYFPDFGVLNLAENAVHNFHNLLPFRGALVRNALNWTGYLAEALQLWGDKAQIMVGQHHWPVWGNDRVVQMIEVQRDLYKFVHDQTLGMINNGMTPHEIAEKIRLPKSIEDHWHARGYYGSLRHNVKAIYQHYMGWYDAVPAHLDPLPPVDTGAKMVEYMGGVEALLTKARTDFDAGNFRWVAQVVNHAVFADPNNQDAKSLLADAYEQLGYLAECATWRNSYLYAAQELRNGTSPHPMRRAIAPDTMATITSHQVFDMLGTRLNAQKADGKRLTLNLTFTDRKEQHVLNLQNSALTHTQGRLSDAAQVSITTTRACFDLILMRDTTPKEEIEAGRLTFTGSMAAFAELFGMLEQPDFDFAIIEP